MCVCLCVSVCAACVVCIRTSSHKWHYALRQNALRLWVRLVIRKFAAFVFFLFSCLCADFVSLIIQVYCSLSHLTIVQLVFRLLLAYVGSGRQWQMPCIFPLPHNRGCIRSMTVTRARPSNRPISCCWVLYLSLLACLLACTLFTGAFVVQKSKKP